MAVKKIINYLNVLTENLAAELSNISEQLIMLNDFIGAENSDFADKVITILKEKKYNAKNQQDYFAAARKELVLLKANFETRRKLFDFWEKIKEFVHASNDGENLEGLINALMMLEKIPTKDIFSVIPFGRKLKKTVSNKNELKIDSSLPRFEDEIFKHVKWIYDEILKIYQIELSQKNKSFWEYSYPLSYIRTYINKEVDTSIRSNPLEILENEEEEFKESKEVLTPMLKKWQLKQMELNSQSKALLDVELISFPGCINSANLTESSFAELVAKMFSLTSYSEAEKQLLAIWLNTNGDQDVTRFSDLLVSGNDFTDSIVDSKIPFPIPYAILSTKLIEQSWYLENGKVCFEYDVFVLSICGPRYIYIDPEIYDNNNPNRNYFISSEKLDPSAQENLSNPNLPPVMRIRGRFHLEVDPIRHAVKPVMDDLVVTCYHPFLQSPERIYGPGKSFQQSSKSEMANLSKSRS